MFLRRRRAICLCKQYRQASLECCCTSPEMCHSHILDHFFHKQKASCSLSASNQLSNTAFQLFPKSTERQPCATGGLRVQTTPHQVVELTSFCCWAAAEINKALWFCHMNKRKCAYFLASVALGCLQ